MFDLLKRMWVQGIFPEARVRLAIEAAVMRGLISHEQSTEILESIRQ